MEMLIHIKAREYFDDHRDEFERGAEYCGFIILEGCSLTVVNMYPNAVCGYIVYQLEGENHVSSRMRVHCVIYDVRGGKSPVGQWFFNEAIFYEDIWPEVRSTMDKSPETRSLQLVPKFCGTINHRTRTGLSAAVLFQSPRAYSNWGNSRCLNHSQLSAMARKLGQFHACVLRRTAATKRTLTLEQASGSQEMYSALHCQMVIPTLMHCLEPLYEDPMYNEVPDFAQGVERLATMVVQLHASVTAASECPKKCRVLCHMNYTQGSVFFKYDGEEVVDILIGNWTTVDFCSLAADLVTLMFVEGAATASHRSRLDLLGNYYDQLTRFGPRKNLPGLGEVVAEIKRCVPIALCLLGARVARLSIAPCLTIGSGLSEHWDYEFATNIFKTLILEKFI